MIRIGIVGCGRILPAHLQGYQRLREAGVDNFRITALCARKPDDARMYAVRGQGPVQRAAVSNIPGDPLGVDDIYLSDFQNDVDVGIFSDYREMLASGSVDAVNDFTSHGMHHVIAEAAAEHGVDLLTQKPLAVTVETARRMCELFEAKDLVLGTFENWRNRDRTRHLKWLFDPDSGSGLPCGRLQAVLFGNMGTWWAPNRIVAQTPWRHRKCEGGGITLDIGVHLFHLIRHVAGEVDNVSGRTAVLEPQRVTLSPAGEVVHRMDCDADDTFFASFETKHGVTGSAFASWGGHGEPTVPGGGPVFYGSSGRVAASKVTLDEGTTCELAELYEAGATDQRKIADFPLGLDDEFARAQLDWLQAVESRTMPETSGREGLHDLACAFAIVESSLAGRTVTLEEIVAGNVREYQRAIEAHFGIHTR